jgi:hypothetical protein
MGTCPREDVELSVGAQSCDEGVRDDARLNAPLDQACAKAAAASKKLSMNIVESFLFFIGCYSKIIIAAIIASTDPAFTGV